MFVEPFQIVFEIGHCYCWKYYSYTKYHFTLSCSWLPCNTPPLCGRSMILVLWSSPPLLWLVFTAHSPFIQMLIWISLLCLCFEVLPLCWCVHHSLPFHADVDTWHKILLALPFIALVALVHTPPLLWLMGQKCLCFEAILVPPVAQPVWSMLSLQAPRHRRTKFDGNYWTPISKMIPKEGPLWIN